MKLDRVCKKMFEKLHLSEKFGLNSLRSDFSDVNMRKMLCLSRFVTMNHSKTRFVCSENVVSGILCLGKLKKPTRFYLIK